MFAHSALLAETANLQKFALRLTGNMSDADDLLQSTCLRALEKEGSFEEGGSLFSWTSKIMFNLFATDYRRKRKFETRREVDKIIERLSVPPMQELNMEVKLIKRALLKLSHDHREIISLICVKEMHYEEVSGLLHISLGTVRSRLFRARRELRTIIDTKSFEDRALFAG